MGGSSVLLRELIIATKDGDWGESVPGEATVPYRVIRGADFPRVRVGDLSEIPLRFLRSETVCRRTLEPNDILIETAGGSRDRSTGRTLLITARMLEELDSPATCASFCRFLRADCKKINPRYLYWHLQYIYQQGAMWEHQVQHTGIARFQFTKFAGSLQVPLPTCTEQEAIAQVLGALDDKIELNRRMNQTLEAMARAIFKSWFVDFEPARRSRPPGQSSSQQGVCMEPIPKGWTWGKLGDVAVNHRRTIGSSMIPPGIPYIGLEHMPRKSIALSEWGQADGVESSKFTFKAKEILFGKLRPYFHKVGVAAVDGVCSTDILVLSPKSNSHWGLVIFLMSSEDFVQYTDRASAGTKMPRTNWTDMARYEFAVPPEDVALAFTEVVEPMVEKVNANILESRSLAVLRDTLLPKLLSGEIRVKQAEEIVGEIL